MKLISLSKLIQDSQTRTKQKEGFEPIDKLSIGDVTYIFGIPFSITQKEDKKLLISFDVSSMDGLLPHFQSLKNKGEKFALTTAYDNSVEVKKNVKRDMDKIKTIVQLKKRDFIKNGFLIKDKDTNPLAIQLTLDIDLPTEKVVPVLTQEKIEQKRKDLGIKNFKESSTEDIFEIIKDQKIKIPKKYENKKGILISTLIEIMSELEEGETTLTKEAQQKVQKRIDANFKNLC